ncbi:MAG: hypothetical protein HKO79_01055, partial [Desulfobacterales bacterium]|nr:hypothetical protein [Desulfobacterales bacterium]
MSSNRLGPWDSVARLAAAGLEESLEGATPDDMLYVDADGNLAYTSDMTHDPDTGVTDLSILDIAGTKQVSAIYDTDGLTEDSDIALATQQSIKAYVDTQFAGAGTGDVTGPAGATDNAIARFSLATGKLIQNSGITIDDSDVLTFTGGTIYDDGVDFFIRNTIPGEKIRFSSRGSDGFYRDRGYIESTYQLWGAETATQVFCDQANTDLYLRASTSDYIWIRDKGAHHIEFYTNSKLAIDCDDGAVDLYYDVTKEAETISGAFKATNAFQIASTTQVDAIYDTDLMTEDSNTALATQQSIKAYVDTEIGGISFPDADKIIEGDSSVEVVDAGFGTITTTIDGTPYIVSNAAGTTFSHTVTIPGATLVVGSTASIKSATTAIELWHNGASKEGETVSGAFKATNGLQIAASGITIDAIYDTDLMTEDSATALVTQQSIKKYVDDTITAANAISQLDTNVTVTDTGTDGKIEGTIDGDVTFTFGTDKSFTVGNIAGELETDVSIIWDLDYFWMGDYDYNNAISWGIDYFNTTGYGEFDIYVGGERPIYYYSSDYGAKMGFESVGEYLGSGVISWQVAMMQETRYPRMEFYLQDSNKAGFMYDKYGFRFLGNESIRPNNHPSVKWLYNDPGMHYNSGGSLTTAWATKQYSDGYGKPNAVYSYDTPNIDVSTYGGYYETLTVAPGKNPLNHRIYVYQVGDGIIEHNVQHDGTLTGGFKALDTTDVFAKIVYWEPQYQGKELIIAANTTDSTIDIYDLDVNGDLILNTTISGAFTDVAINDRGDIAGITATGTSFYDIDVETSPYTITFRNTIPVATMDIQYITTGRRSSYSGFEYSYFFGSGT